MGLFSDHFAMEYDRSTIEVETRTSNVVFGIYRYALIINNKRVEEIEGSLGTFSLRGELRDPTSSTAKPIAIRIKQGFFGTKAFLEVDHESYLMPRA